MRLLKNIWKWWRRCWSDDLLWSAADSHQWDNKVEILRRLSDGAH